MEFDIKSKGLHRILNIYKNHIELILENRNRVVHMEFNLDFINTINRHTLKHVYIKGDRVYISKDSTEELKSYVARFYKKLSRDEINTITFNDGNTYNFRLENLNISIKASIESVIMYDTTNLVPEVNMVKEHGWSRKLFYIDDYAIVEFYKFTSKGKIIVQGKFDKFIIERLDLGSLTLDYRKNQLNRNTWRIKYLKNKIHRYILEVSKMFEVDHLDRNPLNNTLINLRICDHRTNVLNQDVSIKSNTGIKGIQNWKHNITGKEYIRVSYNIKSNTQIFRFIDPLKYSSYNVALTKAIEIRSELEKEYKYVNEVCSHEGSETIESSYRSKKN